MNLNCIIHNIRSLLLRPNEITQRETLSASIAELLWKVGDKKRAILAVPENNPVFEASVRFSMDGVTEKVFRFSIFASRKEIKTLSIAATFVQMLNRG